MPARTKKAATGKKGSCATTNKGQRATRQPTLDAASDGPAAPTTSTPDAPYEPLGPPPHRRTSRDGAGAPSTPLPWIPSTPPPRPRVFDENSPPTTTFNTFERDGQLYSRLSPSPRTQWASDAGVNRFSPDVSPVIRQGRYDPPSPLQKLPPCRTPENMQDTSALLDAFYDGPSTPTRASYKTSPGILGRRGDRRTQKSSEDAAVAPQDGDPFVAAAQDAEHPDASVTVAASDAPVDVVGEELVEGEKDAEEKHNERSGKDHEDDADVSAPAHSTKEGAAENASLPSGPELATSSVLTTVEEPAGVRAASPGEQDSQPTHESAPSNACEVPELDDDTLFAPRPDEGHFLADGQEAGHQLESSGLNNRQPNDLLVRYDEVAVPYDQARSKRKRARSQSKDGERDDQASHDEVDKRRRAQKRLRKEQDGHVQAGPVAPGTLRSPRAYSMAAAEQQQPEDVQDAREDVHASAPRFRATTRPPHDEEAQHQFVLAHALAPAQLPPPPPPHQYQQLEQQQPNCGPAPFAQAPAQWQLQQAPGFVYNPQPFEVHYPQLGYGVYYPPEWYDPCILPPQDGGVQNPPPHQWAPQQQLYAHHGAHTHSAGAHQMPLADQVVQGAQPSVAAPQQPQLASTTQPAAPAAAQPTPAGPATLSFANGAPPAVHPPPAGILCKWHARCTYVFDTSLLDDDLKAAVQEHFETEIKGKWVEVQEPGKRRRREKVEVGEWETRTACAWGGVGTSSCFINSQDPHRGRARKATAMVKHIGRYHLGRPHWR
ncbi:hypothetical protein K523DRAFT_318054 [Schizophyllum commune Tattone D]|nr:hypothetical protein K523DRAFT_318054 [Schizophyllum commune Tattone D]